MNNDQHPNHDRIIYLSTTIPVLGILVAAMLLSSPSKRDGRAGATAIGFALLGFLAWFGLWLMLDALLRNMG